MLPLAVYSSYWLLQQRLRYNKKINEDNNKEREEKINNEEQDVTNQEEKYKIPSTWENL